MYTKLGHKNWGKITAAAIQKHTEEKYQQAARNMSCLWWLRDLVIPGQMDKPPEKFWPASRYNVAGRAATATRIKLLVGHSWVAGGVARRHAGSGICPLCNDSEETLEHFLYECSELQDERKEAESRTNVKLVKTQAAVVTLMEAGPHESMLIHQLYKARVQMEIERSPDSTAKPS